MKEESPTRPAVTDADVEPVAEALWQAESLRAMDRHRLSTWAEESEDTRAKWRFMARAALEADRAYSSSGVDGGLPKGWGEKLMALRMADWRSGLLGGLKHGPEADRLAAELTALVKSGGES